MNEDELKSLWQSDAAGMPTAFTVGELERARQPAAPVRAPASWVESGAWLRALLTERRETQVARLWWLLLVFPLAGLLRVAVEHARWSVPVLVALLMLGIGLAGRQVVRILAAGRALADLRAALTSPEMPRRPAYRLALLMACCAVTMGVGYWAWGQHVRQARLERQQKQDLAQCDAGGAPDAALAIAACERVLQMQPDHVEAVAALRRLRPRQACEEQVRVAKVMAQEGYAEEALGAFSSLGGECSETLIAAAAAKAVPLVAGVLSSSRAQCLAAVEGEKWTSAVVRCGVYARYACQRMKVEEMVPPQGKTFVSAGALGANGWRPADPAYLGLLQARERLGDLAPWQCPESAVLRATGIQRELETLAVDANDFLKTPQLESDEFLRAAQAAVDQQRLIEALESYRKAIAADPENADAWLGLGYVNQELNRKKDAISAFKKYLELNPEAPNRKEVSDLLYFLEGK